MTLIKGNRNMLSSAMLANETPIVYTTTHNEIVREDKYCGHDIDSDDYHNYEYHYHYYITTSQSQGFFWNQDLFVTQYQQNFQVEYDGHEDSIENIIDDSEERLTGRLYNDGRRRSRRRSNNSISLTEDAKNGCVHQQQQSKLISYVLEEKDELNIENKEHPLNYYKWLVS